MTRTITYEDLFYAADDAQKRFDGYEHACWAFLRDLRDGMEVYLKAPAGKLYWRRYSDRETTKELEHKGVVRLSASRHMVLYDDARYGAHLHMDIGKKQLMVPLRVKKTDNGFAVWLGEEKHEVGLGSKEDLERLIVQIVTIVKDHLETQFEAFLKGQPAVLGFPGMVDR